MGEVVKVALAVSARQNLNMSRLNCFLSRGKKHNKATNPSYLHRVGTIAKSKYRTCGSPSALPLSMSQPSRTVDNTILKVPTSV